MVRPTVKVQLLRVIAGHIKDVDLSPLKKIKVSFNPFSEKVLSAREYFYYMSARKIQQTNYSCSLVSEVKSDLSKPSVECTFNDGEKALFKTDTLQLKEIVEEMNKLCQEKSRM